MSARLQAPKGTQDVLPADAPRWQALERLAREVAHRYGFAEIRTPAFEATDLFHRGVGETTDIVSKETYTFDDRGGRSLTLRPEGTAAVVRALLQSTLLNDAGSVAKVYYVPTPMFRYEKPQAGRLHQHHQFGCEAFGVAAPEQDVEILCLQYDFYRSLGLQNVSLKLNTLGDGQSKQQYADALRAFYGQKKDQLSEESQRRLTTNPLRILDSKDPRDVAASAGVPANAEFLSDKSRTHFDRVQALLTKLQIPFTLEPKLVRGIDYYTETLWEFEAAGLGAHNVIGGGGRYDNLVEQLGGRPTPAVGFGSGLERLLLALEAQGVALPVDDKPLIWFVTATEAARDAAFEMITQLRRAGLRVDADLTGRTIKAQFKLADRAKAAYSLVLGDDELAAGTIVVKDLAARQQTTIPQADVVAHLTSLA